MTTPADHPAIDQVVLLMVSGMAQADLLAACVDSLGIAPNDAPAVIAAAQAKIIAAATIDRGQELGAAVTRLKDLYARALRDKDNKTALAAQRELAKLLDLSRPATPIEAPTPADDADGEGPESAETNGKGDQPGAMAESTESEPFCIVDLSQIVHRQKKAFLLAYARTGFITKAARVAGVHRNCHSLWMKADPNYALAFAEAKGIRVEALEAEADRRGIQGVKRPVYQGGKLVGYVQDYSDVLLIFRLKALAPQKYRERLSLSGPDGKAPVNFGPQQIQILLKDEKVLEAAELLIEQFANMSQQQQGPRLIESQLSDPPEERSL